jgi:hypothetical protein
VPSSCLIVRQGTLVVECRFEIEKSNKYPVSIAKWEIVKKIQKVQF